MKAHEGDLIQTGDNIIFDVKGLVHPPDKIIAFPRYIPEAHGTRRRGSQLYGKVYNLAERYRYLQQHAPSLLVFDPVFDEIICEVPVNTITRLYEPVRKLQQLRSRKRLADLESKALTLVQELKKTAGIPWSSIGISGSIMAGLFTLQSDIDPIVYGMENCRKAYAALETLLKNGNSRFRPYTMDELKALFDFRSKDTKMTFEDFLQIERRKAFQGKFDGVDYFVRFVKNWDETNEKYGDLTYSNKGSARITAEVADDSEALFTPCAYKLREVRIIQGPQLHVIGIASFRGRFCLQAKIGEKVIAQGKVEHVKDTRKRTEYHRIIIGNDPSDFMALSNS